MRDLVGPRQALAIRELLQSLFITECLKPSDPLWILSGWISDIAIINNSAREFSGIDPDWPTGDVLLSQALRTLLARGGRTILILRDVSHNHSFVSRLSHLQREYPRQLLWFLGEYKHEKGIVGEEFEISGSMNFTHTGIEVSGEHLIYRTDPKVVSERRLSLLQQYQDLLNA